MIFERLWHAFVMAFVGTLCVLFVGLLGALIVSISTEQHAFDSRIWVVDSRVYQGSTLIGVCGGQPPTRETLPKSDDPSVDVTWYPECPR